MVTQTENSDDGLLAHLGMPDLPTALDKAEGSMAQLRAGAREALELFDGLTTEALIVMGLIARAQSLHQGITNAASKHFGGFSAVYRTLSEYAHPAWRAVVASHQVLDETEGAARLAWQSAPRFRSEGDALMACAWVWELTEAHEHLLLRTAAILAGAPRLDN